MLKKQLRSLHYFCNTIKYIHKNKIFIYKIIYASSFNDLHLEANCNEAIDSDKFHLAGEILTNISSLESPDNDSCK